MLLLVLEKFYMGRHQSEEKNRTILTGGNGGSQTSFKNFPDILWLELFSLFSYVVARCLNMSRQEVIRGDTKLV